ncbi:type II secretion system protein [Thermus tenuipuniceus]|uniref:type IV pilus modification PilV family protein n=1 Tax=Thermus tenuipuniceus TaxID=2078690 RepID=UPI000CF9D9DB
MKRGLTLVEVLVALAILALIGPILAGFLGYLRVNTRTELRSQAVTLAQERLEALRLVDITSLPTSGCQEADQTRAGRTYRIRTCYCTQAVLCGSGARHIRVEVYLGREAAPLYTVETVYTKLE